MERVRANNMMTVLAGIGNVEIIENMFGAFTIKRELFTAFEHRLIIVIQLVFGFAQHGHMLVNTRHQHVAAPDSDDNPQRRYG
ncbi:hypothetical protein D3C78_1205980 [compost metagenome]